MGNLSLRQNFQGPQEPDFYLKRLLFSHGKMLVPSESFEANPRLKPILVIHDMETGKRSYMTPDRMPEPSYTQLPQRVANIEKTLSGELDGVRTTPNVERVAPPSRVAQAIQP